MPSNVPGIPGDRIHTMDMYLLSVSSRVLVSQAVMHVYEARIIVIATIVPCVRAGNVSEGDVFEGQPLGPLGMLLLDCSRTSR